MSGLFGNNQTISTTENKLGGIQIQQSSYGTPIPLVYGKTRIASNLIDYIDFTAIPHTSTQSSGGKAGGGVTTSNTTYTYTSTLAMGLCQGGAAGEIQIGAVWLDKSKFATTAAVTGSSTSPLSSALAGGMTAITFATQSALLSEPKVGGWTLFDGNPAQSAWGYMTTYYPERAVTYRGLAYLGGANHELLSGALIGNYSFEVIGLMRYSTSIDFIDDACPQDAFVDFMTHALHGAGFPATALGDLSAFRNWCIANTLFISPAFTQQKAAGDHWVDILDAVACAPVYSDGLLKIIPYGDAAITAHGATYTPNITPVYNLTDDDFLNADQPVLVRRKAQADAYNEFQAEYKSRANDYNTTTINVKDQATIERYGLRPAAVAKWDFIAAPDVAMKCAQMKLQRGIYIRNEYEFKLPPNYARLEQMDVVTLTDAGLGLNLYPVRITSTDEAEDGEITVTAEELVYGVTAAAMFAGNQAPLGGLPNANASPGNICTPPLYFQAPAALSFATKEIWFMAGGGYFVGADWVNNPDWGGCNVWWSLDGTNYSKIGSIEGGARYGVLHSAVSAPPGANPDVTNTITADLLSLRQLYSVSTADLNGNNSLCYVDGEIIGYRDAALVAVNRYSLSYLRRGLFGTTAAAHPIGTWFARLDTQNIFKFSLDPYGPVLVGTTVNFKFTSWNRCYLAEENLADVATYYYTVI